MATFDLHRAERRVLDTALVLGVALAKAAVLSHYRGRDAATSIRRRLTRRRAA